MGQTSTEYKLAGALSWFDTPYKAKYNLMTCKYAASRAEGTDIEAQCFPERLISCKVKYMAASHSEHLDR